MNGRWKDGFGLRGGREADVYHLLLIVGANEASYRATEAQLVESTAELAVHDVLQLPI